MYEEATGYRTLTETEEITLNSEALEAVKGVLRRNAKLSIRTIASETSLSKSVVGRIVKGLNEAAGLRGVELSEYLEGA